MSRVYVVRCQKSRMGNEQSPSRDLAFERCTRNYNGEGPPSAADRHLLPAAIDIAPTVLGGVHRRLGSFVFGIASQKLVVENDIQK
jgi:hypothetical protein